jgi:anti-sigma factor RsiW
MSLDEHTLLAYVDGELSAQRRAEVGAALAVNAELALTVRHLQGSRLPYQSAFERAAVPSMPPLPDALRERIEALSAVAVASHGAALVSQGRASELAQLPPGNQRWWMMAGLALLTLLLGLALGRWSATGMGKSGGGAIEPWIAAASSYHAMYARETVLDGGEALTQVAALKARLLTQHNINLQIPDLNPEGLRFIRAQQLQFDGKLVIQLVYLPQSGPPIALCLTPTTAQANRATLLDQQQVLAWQNGAWAYALVGQLPAPVMQRLRERLALPLV